MRERVCIVTSGHVGSAPRVVKEADALASAGYDTHVVAVDVTKGVRPFDRSIEERAQWTLHRVVRGSFVPWRTRSVLHWLAQPLWRAGVRGAWSEAHVSGRLTGPLAARAASLDAGLYVGHNVSGLVAAGLAARRRGAVLGFDAEDDHVGELSGAPVSTAKQRARLNLMRPWIARCAHRTASAPLIALNCERLFDKPFTTVLNVFPMADAAGLAAPRPSSEALRGYWFSQTVGPGRGLERALRLLASIPMLSSLHLRGYVEPRYADALQTRRAALGLPPDRLAFLPSALPGEMTRLCAGYTLGLSLEEPTDDNKRACLGNKIFQYLLAGLPVLLSDTPAQRALAQELGTAALLLQDAGEEAQVRELAGWLASPARREESQAAAWRLARSRFNWDQERAVLLAGIAGALATR
jgi:hypothetical protein